MFSSKPAETRALDKPSPRHASVCPVEDWLAFLGHRWNALILWHLKSKARRHAELMECLPGITPKVLSERLVGLDQRGLIKREPLATFPRGVRYELTQPGKRLVLILDQLELWAKTARHGRTRGRYCQGTQLGDN